MARDIRDIQTDIERTRRQLASTLDEIADRTNPHSLTAEAKRSATDKLTDPTVQKVLAGVGAAVVGIIAISVARSRKKNKDIKEVQRLLAGRK